MTLSVLFLSLPGMLSLVLGCSRPGPDPYMCLAMSLKDAIVKIFNIKEK